ncbi:hypothetical protein SAMN05444169_4952 [Bradyrhizobium erythrophlei]|uniref:Uncharacterized protein n=1 Tax=Bradyrhizobium erythrophlei TaxID=1437360 RepID=A0A1M5P0X8_9BRAD|nr:hypothetical protein SAMN05444169_4952 [Bradyrhizobium erythrophlei]
MLPVSLLTTPGWISGPYPTALGKNEGSETLIFHDRTAQPRF